VIRGVSPDLPHTDRLPAPKEWVLRLTRPLVRLGLRLGWRVKVHDARYIPSSGPVILAANHIGLLDGPALVALTRRLTFAMVKREAFSGPIGQFLSHVAKGGAAYLAMVSGAPIVPVAILGTREPGQHKNQVPRLRRPIHLVCGEPFDLPRSPWPRRKAVVAEWTEVVRKRLADHVVAAQAVAGLPLPGPPKIKASTIQRLVESSQPAQES
jgi:1-acyl-sn-glycerol-3-phosphate acyltransferase